LDEALAKALSAYDRERLHPAPTEVVAQNIGYKSANNGSALSALASLRYFGLLERPREGLLSVTKEVEAYKFSPNEALKRSTLLGFLRRPQLYEELLEKYESGLPSDANLKFELIQRGFAPHAAESVLTAFRRSVEFAGYFDSNAGADQEDIASAQPVASVLSEAAIAQTENPQTVDAKSSQMPASVSSHGAEESSSHDRIPVRLRGGRRAWLLIPSPFFEADKARLKAQIDLLLTDEDEPGVGNAPDVAKSW